MEFGLWIDIALCLYHCRKYIFYFISFLFKWLLEILIGIHKRRIVYRTNTLENYTEERCIICLYFFVHIQLLSFLHSKHLILFLEKWIMNFYGFNKCYRIVYFNFTQETRRESEFYTFHVCSIGYSKENVIDVNIIDLFLRFYFIFTVHNSRIWFGGNELFPLATHQSPQYTTTTVNKCKSLTTVRLWDLSP